MAPNYRVLVNYDPERAVFVARAPELEHCSADGATRAEALAKIEEEMSAQIDNVRERGGQAPLPLDDQLAEHDGALAAKVSRTLHRDLAWQARVEGVDLGQLVGEILAAGLEVRRQRVGRRPSPNAQPGQQRGGGPDDDDNRGQRMDNRGRDERGGGGGGGGNRRGQQQGQGGRYHAIMEDRASFIEHVRQLEQGGGQGGGGGRGGGPRRDDRRDDRRDRGGRQGGTGAGTGAATNAGTGTGTGTGSGTGSGTGGSGT